MRDRERFETRAKLKFAFPFVVRNKIDGQEKGQSGHPGTANDDYERPGYFNSEYAAITTRPFLKSAIFLPRSATMHLHPLLLSQRGPSNRTIILTTNQLPWTPPRRAHRSSASISPFRSRWNCNCPDLRRDHAAEHEKEIYGARQEIGARNVERRFSECSQGSEEASAR